jgi:hypothetical protein
VSKRGCGHCREKSDPVEFAIQTISMVVDQSFQQNANIGIYRRAVRSTFWWWRLLR